MEFKNQYLTYMEYIELGGNLSENAFNLLEYEAKKKIDKLTFGRLKNLTKQNEEVKMCINKLMSVMNENNCLLKSESVDGYSITYLDNKDLKQAFNDIVEDYLSECVLEDGTPYLYIGV